MGNGSRDDIVERSETLPFPEQNLDENIPSTRKMRRRRLRGLSIVQNTPNSEEGNSEQQTAVGSSNVPETLDEPEEFQVMLPENGGTRRVRGRTLLSDLYDLDPANRVKDRERVGISSRQKQKFTHTAGSRSFASVAEAEKKDGSPMTSEAGEIMEKLKDKKAEYEATASTDSSVNLENIDNRIITEVLGPERYGRVRFQGSGVTPTQYFGSGSQQYMPSGSQAKAEVQRLRDQMAQMQANTVEQIAEVQRKYEELQQQLRAEAAEREAAAVEREQQQQQRGRQSIGKEGLNIGVKNVLQICQISGVCGKNAAKGHDF
ncbi:hypothetical protein CXB51_026013 [Gossypium anomalum]|uniref:Uncharacterized protein n=1 Tax=Gossypium anomalum TaxID=47600 RepID=A0A8J5YDI2_9ROSI|nr:hypothetical protein CXB51_026013 [Gossypium anomalum]